MFFLALIERHSFGACVLLVFDSISMSCLWVYCCSGAYNMPPSDHSLSAPIAWFRSKPSKTLHATTNICTPTWCSSFSDIL